MGKGRLWEARVNPRNAGVDASSAPYDLAHAKQNRNKAKAKTKQIK